MNLKHEETMKNCILDDYESIYNDLRKKFEARIEELTNHILDLEQILFENDLSIPNDNLVL